jgi:2-amino-4-hydroxy-6-hydroxymethyldihydropteridine diphosphokinase
MARNTAYVALGSNLGDREGTLREALRAMAQLPDTALGRVSNWLENPAQDSPEGAGPFLNGVAELKTGLSALELLTELLNIERRLGRDRRNQSRNAPRTLDLDLLLYGKLVIEAPGLQIPHPRMHERFFVLWPLIQVAPRIRDPRTGKPFAEDYFRLAARLAPS